MVESNELIKKDFNIDTNRIRLKEQKKNIFNKLVEEKAFEFKNFEKRINSDILIYNYKTEGRSQEGFRNYQNPVEF